MQLVDVQEKVIKGLAVRTNNKAEQSADTAKIPGLWGDVASNHFSHMLAGSKVFGVYYNYQSDVNGDYDLLVGADKFADSAENLSSVTIKQGKYLKFNAIGEMPDVCIALWGEIWKYFYSQECEYTRAYSTDFEEYTSDGLNIYISIK